jgi:hypothetical protein
MKAAWAGTAAIEDAAAAQNTANLVIPNPPADAACHGTDRITDPHH